MLHPRIWQVFFPNDYIVLYGESICSWQHAVCLAVYQAQGSSIVVNLLCSIGIFGPMNPKNISALPESDYLEIELVQTKGDLTRY